MVGESLGINLKAILELVRCSTSTLGGRNCHVNFRRPNTNEKGGYMSLQTTPVFSDGHDLEAIFLSAILTSS